MVTPRSIPQKTDFGIAFLHAASIEQRKKLDIRLRQLLILIDGKKTIAELIKHSFSGIDIAAFKTLQAKGFVAIDGVAIPPPAEQTIENDNLHAATRPSAAVAKEIATPIQPTKTTKPTASLSQLRFDALDILLDLSMEDFAVRSWIDDFEKADSIERIMYLIQQFKASPVGQKHPGFVQRLQKL